MAQRKQWEKEYRDSKFITKYDKPQKFFLRYKKYLNKEKGIKMRDLSILDLGSGTGRNSNYLSEIGSSVVGIEISPTAIAIAKKRAGEKDVNVEYLNQSIGAEYPLDDDSFDLVIDITSSNALNEKEREVYLTEIKRVLKKDGKLFVRALCKDGDKNAKKLIKDFPGKEKDTYVMPETKIIERVFSEVDFRELYSKHFKIDKIIKEESYSKFNNQSYKRRFLLGYLENN